MWNEKYNWFFEQGAADGFNDPGISEFKSVKYDGLAREIIQNSLDAKNPKLNQPVKVIFEQQSYDMSYFPGYQKYLKTVEACIDYIKDEKGNKSISSLEEIKKVLYDAKNRNKFNVMKISDYNTLGLSGSSKIKGTPWANLVRRTGNSNKREGAGGSFGVGKYAPFVFSKIRSIIYSTKDLDGNIALQGKSILAGHIYDSAERSPKGYFGQSTIKQIDYNTFEDSAPINNKFEIPDAFLRDEVGTSLFILCATIETNWNEEVRNSVINSFFWSILTGKLEVEIISGENKIIINKNTLNKNVNDCINSTTKNKQSLLTLEYLKIFNMQNEYQRHVKVFDLSTSNETKYGEMELLIISNKDIETKSIAHIRETGMKIEDKTYSSIIGYVGITRTLNDEMNNFLRECEAPKHDEWSANNYGNNEQDTTYAKKILKEISEWERSIVKSLSITNTSKKLDPLGMEEFLPSDISDDETIDNKTNELLTFKPLQVEIGIKKNSKQTYTDSNNSGFSITEDEEETIEESIHNSHGSNGPGGGNGQEGNEWTQNPQGTLHEKVKVPITYVKTPYLNEKGKYLISFIPLETTENCYLKIRRAGDDILEELTIEDLFIINGSQKQKVETFSLKENKKIIFEVNFKEIDREALEVNCYVKK